MSGCDGADLATQAPTDWSAGLPAVGTICRGPRQAYEGAKCGHDGAREAPDAAARTTGDRSDAATGIAELRERYRPDRVRLLMVGESSPAGGTHFYRANSHLYRATREALRLAAGLDDAPDGAAFLAWCRELGLWLVDVADAPVNDLEPTDRRRLVERGTRRLAEIMVDAQPEHVVAIKATIAPAVRAAARIAGVDAATIDVLPFPLHQGRTTFIQQLTAIARRTLPALAGPAADPRGRVADEHEAYGPSTLHAAIAEVLREHGNAWLSARRIADEIARTDRWRRPSDGQPPPARQVRARVRNYPELFQVSDLGIRLRAP